MPSHLGDQPRPPTETLTPEDQRLARKLEEIYGPPKWGWGDWSGESAEPKRPSASITRRRPLSSVVARTLLLLALAVASWSIAFGDREALGQALMEPLRAVGIVEPASVPASTAEYLLALQTLEVGEVPPPSAATVRQLKDLLDQMTPKCKEDRFLLATAILSAHDELASRGVGASASSILTKANATLSDQTRQLWPTNCSDIVNRIARSQ